MIVLFCTVCLLLGIVVKQRLYSTSLAIERDRLQVDLTCTKSDVERYKKMLKAENENTEQLIKQVAKLKQSPYLIEKKAEVKIYNLEEIVSGYHRYSGPKEIQRIYCDKLKLSLPDYLINYSAEKIGSKDIKIKASIRIIETLE